MSWKRYESEGKAMMRLCLVCGRRFTAHPHQKLCNQCKRMVGNRHNLGTKGWNRK